MGSYNTFSRVTGKSYPFIIDGDAPSQTEMARINAILAEEEGITTKLHLYSVLLPAMQILKLHVLSLYKVL